MKAFAQFISETEEASDSSYYKTNEIDLYEYDETIASHPFIDACNASILYTLLQHLGTSCSGKRVLDAGSGTGQVSRLLQGIPGLNVEACDCDKSYESFFRSHPELSDIRFIHHDLLNGPMSMKFDAVVCRGVYHHIPKLQRHIFLKNLSDMSNCVIVADEALLEYADNDQRLLHCDKWYSYVIQEARRRKVYNLVKMESIFWTNEYLNSADDGGDFKESPSHFLDDASKVNLRAKTLQRYGPWGKACGGFFTAALICNPKL